MFYKINDNNQMYYEYLNKQSDTTIVFLHGWGTSLEEFDSFKHLEENILLVDFVGFGKSSKITSKLSLYDYVRHLHLLIESLNLNSIILVGHSFGGRVSILYSYLYNVNRIVLVGSAGIKPKRTIKYYTNVYTYKLQKLIYKLLRKSDESIKHKGSSDYKILNDFERATFSLIVNKDLKKYLKKLKSKVLIMHGVHDQTIHFRDAVLMHKLITDSKLIPYYNSGHFLYKNEHNKFIKVLKRFIDDDLN